MDREASDDEDDNHDGPLEMVNLVMNRINRSRRILDDAEESVDSDATLELHLSDGDLPSDTDSEVDIVQRYDLCVSITLALMSNKHSALTLIPQF